MQRGRRQFIERCATLIGGAAVSNLSRGTASHAGQAGADVLTNWAGNYRYATNRVLRPSSVGAIQDFMRASRRRFKVLGSRHCFNGIADSEHVFLSLEDLTEVVSLDREARTVTVEAGLRYGPLCPWLHEQGFALHNLASLPHISIAGACATATHGSGVENGNLATAVTALELISGDGSVVRLSRGRDEEFPGAVVHLGALGVVTQVTLEVQSAFTMRQNVYLDLSMAELERNFDSIMSAGYSVSLFTDWRNRRVNAVWIKQREPDGAPAPAEFHGAAAAKTNVHPIVGLSAEHCTGQMGVPGPWYERLPHFRMGFTPSSGKELQSEYFVPRKNAVDAILAVERLHGQVSPHLLISEIRTIAADDLWMSPCYQQPSVAIHFTWKQEPDAVNRLMPIIERELTPFGVRPHWGKLFAIARADLVRRYPRFDDFRALVSRFDPRGRFRNAFLATHVFG